MIVAIELHQGAFDMQVTTIGLDIAKNVFQVHGIDASEKDLFGGSSGAARCLSSSRHCCRALSACRPRSTGSSTAPPGQNAKKKAGAALDPTPHQRRCHPERPVESVSPSPRDKDRERQPDEGRRRLPSARLDGLAKAIDNGREQASLGDDMAKGTARKRSKKHPGKRRRAIPLKQSNNRRRRRWPPQRR